MDKVATTVSIFSDDRDNNILFLVQVLIKIVRAVTLLFNSLLVTKKVTKLDKIFNCNAQSKAT